MLGPFVRHPPTTWFARFMMWLMFRRPWGVSAVAAFYRSLNAGVAPPDLVYPRVIGFLDRARRHA